MKRIGVLFASIWMFASSVTIAQTKENFNARNEITITQLKGYLQNHCWSFPDFDINRNSWNPGIEGSGALVSGTGKTRETGIYSPVLKVPGSIRISFKYKFSSLFSGEKKPGLKIYLVNPENEIQKELENIELAGTNTATIYSYNKSFPARAGNYKVFINFQGIGESRPIAIDELEISAPLLYAGGCNEAPVAVNDRITGNANRTASGFMGTNDYDPNGDSFDTYLVTNSPNGVVTLNPDKSFSFMPNPGFTGNSTSFTYQLCDNGAGPLCSNKATVTISFPSGGFLPVSLSEFSGKYDGEGNVELDWATVFEQNSDKFELERSFNGTDWKTAGMVKAQGVSTGKKSYSFTDNAGRNTVHKNDLYYRLRMTDQDGKSSLSRILVVRVYNGRYTKMISVSPNPTKNDIAANIQLNESSVVVLKIMNNSGNVVMHKTTKLAAGSNSLLMEGSSKLTPGMYIMEVIVNSSEQMLVKLVKD